MQHLTTGQVTKLDSLNVTLSGKVTGTGTFDANGNVTVTTAIGDGFVVNDLKDVTITGVVDGEMLKMDNGQWINTGVIDCGVWAAAAQ
jgi:uncharacterized protein (DUF342 family)